MQRIKTTYGNGAFCCWAPSHHEFGFLEYTALITRMFNVYGGFTTRMSPGHSWVGWQYGGIYEWGYSASGGYGAQNDDLWDTMQNSNTVVHWGVDPINTELVRRIRGTNTKIQLVQIARNQTDIHMSGSK